MRKNKKLIKLIILSLVSLSVLVLVVIFFLNKKSVSGEDFKLAIVADDGVALVSISSERKMTNILKFDKDTNLWIPGGLGWYRNEIIKNLLKQEKKMEDVKDLFFYNFGFYPDKIISLNKIDDWKKKYWLRYRLASNKMLVKEEILTGNIRDQENLLDEIMIRDFSETKLVKEDLKLSVFNSSNINGLANFMSRRFEWMGFSVVSSESSWDLSLGDKCLIKYGNKVIETLGWLVINRSIDCNKEYDENLNEGEIELYFGEKFSSVIKYPSYYN